MRIIAALQLFFMKGESTGNMSLTTPIELPPLIESISTTYPNNLKAKPLKASALSGADSWNDLATVTGLATEI